MQKCERVGGLTEIPTFLVKFVYFPHFIDFAFKINLENIGD